MLIKNNLVRWGLAPSVQNTALVLIAVFTTMGILNHFSLTNLSNGMLLFSVVVFGFLLALLVSTHQNLANKHLVMVFAAFSGLMAASIVIGDKINLFELAPINLMWKDLFFWAAWFILIFCACSYTFLQIQKIQSPKIKSTKVSISLWLRLSLTMFILWIPYLLAFFPGILNSDTSDQFNQAFGGARLNDHHPVLIAGFISLFAHTGLFISNNYYVAIAFVTVAQMALAALVLGYASSWIVSRFSLSRIHILTILFYAVFPFVPYFLITIGKDTLFALSVLLFTMAVYDFVVSKGELLKRTSWVMAFVLISLLVIFTRNNGIYLVAISFFALALVYRKQWKRTLPTFAVTIGISLLIHGPLFSVLGIPLSKSTESFSMLIQQVGRTIALKGDLSDNDKRALIPILPIEKWSRYYTPATPDRLKFCYTSADACMNNEYLDKHKLDFLRTWMSIGVKNPRIYLEALFVQNSGFWHIGSPDDYGSYRSDERRYTTGSTDVLRTKIGIHTVGAIVKSTQSIRNSPLGLLVNQGSLIWIVLFAGTVFIIQKRYTLLLVLLPAASLWLSLMAAAPAMSFRYSLATFLTLPVILAITLSSNKAIQKN